MSEVSLAIECDRQRQAALWRYQNDAVFNHNAQAAMKLLRDGDEAGFLAVLDHLSGEDFGRIELLQQELREVMRTFEDRKRFPQ